MTETNPLEAIAEMEAYVTRIQAGAAIIHSLLQEIADIHDENEDGSRHGCGEAYPCPTMQVIFSQMVVEKN
jgi:hypothetical protein